MSRMIAASLAAALMSPGALAQVDRQAPAQPAPLRSRLSDDVVKDAVKQALAEAPADRASQPAPVLRSSSYARFARQFNDAKVPDCLHPDALKFEPVEIQLSKDWTFSLAQLFPLPFWLAAAATGKCR